MAKMPQDRLPATSIQWEAMPKRHVNQPLCGTHLRRRIAMRRIAVGIATSDLREEIRSTASQMAQPKANPLAHPLGHATTPLTALLGSHPVA